MTSQNRQARITDLRKEQERKSFLSDFLYSLSIIAGYEISFESVLSIEETKNIIHQIHYRNSQYPTFSCSFPFTQAEKLKKLLLILNQDFIESDCYLTTNRFSNNIYLLLNATFIIDGFEKIIELDTNTFYIYNKNLTNGLFIDSNEENWTENSKTEYVWTYEIRVWGKDWVDKIYLAYTKIVK